MWRANGLLNKSKKLMIATGCEALTTHGPQGRYGSFPGDRATGGCAEPRFRTIFLGPYSTSFLKILPCSRYVPQLPLVNPSFVERYKAQGRGMFF